MNLFRFQATALDLGVAALAGLSVAFAVFAAPAELLGGFGLSADPRVRIVTGAVAILLVSGAVLMLLRWLDRLGESPIGADGLRPPRVRRRDSHPDAPPPVPLSAARELAEPAAAEPHRRHAWMVDVADPDLPEGSSPASLPELVARLEQSFAREEAPPSPRVSSISSEDRLQSAIQNLQRLAAGRG